MTFVLKLLVELVLSSITGVGIGGVDSVVEANTVEAGTIMINVAAETKAFVAMFFKLNPPLNILSP